MHGFPLIRHPNKRATALTYEHQKRTEALQFPLIRHPNKRATEDESLEETEDETEEGFH